MVKQRMHFCGFLWGENNGINSIQNNLQTRGYAENLKLNDMEIFIKLWSFLRAVTHFI